MIMTVHTKMYLMYFKWSFPYLQSYLSCTLVSCYLRWTCDSLQNDWCSSRLELEIRLVGLVFLVCRLPRLISHPFISTHLTLVEELRLSTIWWIDLNNLYASLYQPWRVHKAVEINGDWLLTAYLNDTKRCECNVKKMSTFNTFVFSMSLRIGNNCAGMRDTRRGISYSSVSSTLHT